eukprot:TRINITY_DN36890_c0_g1_i1.p2 TRINITY_DN36890_c0_g1~~TRINITY_DN36890_c0_g1_i1.p2  ORF type:complete len:196 (-),score=29.00 TRINITY_DN36890_c0_g1_i1:54-641(-)
MEKWFQEPPRRPKGHGKGKGGKSSMNKHGDSSGTGDGSSWHFAPNARKHFKNTGDSQSHLRHAVEASLELGLDTARLVRMQSGSCIPTCLVPRNSACDAAFALQPDLDNPGESKAKQWTKLVEELAKMAQIKDEFRKTLQEHFLSVQRALKENQLFQLELGLHHVSIYPTFENRDMFKVELSVGPELRSVQLAVF